MLDNAVDLVCFTGIQEFSYSSAEIVHNMFKIFFKSLTFALLLFIYSLLIRVYKANIKMQNLDLSASAGNYFGGDF